MACRSLFRHAVRPKGRALKSALTAQMARRLIAAKVSMVLALTAGVQGCQSSSLFVPSERLSPAVSGALDSLILTEWQSEAMYQQARRDFGDRAPFKALASGPGKNAFRLEQVYRIYGAFPPRNPYHGDAITRFSSLVTACAASVESTTEVATRYAQLLTLDAPGTVRRVVKENRARVLEDQVPAATRCAALAARQ